jgi:hypothetical protein
MRQSFVSDQSLSSLCLGDYQRNIHQFREEAADRWRDSCFAFDNEKAFGAEAPPSFFIDKYSFRIWLAHTTSTDGTALVSVPETDFSQLFAAYDETVRQSVVGSKLLGTNAPAVDEPVVRSTFLDDQFGAWQSHLACNGIDLPSDVIDWYFSVPLLEVYCNSVFYPRFPVLWGPNYFGKISDQDREHILQTYGEGAVWDFYFLMMVCHEQSHLMQKGEPILNEIAHAILWIDFVLEQGLKPFQVNSDTGKTCNIEAPFILGRTEELKGLNYKVLYEDNLTYFEQGVADVEYSLFVALTFLVHTGVVRYRYATNLFCGMLAEDDSVVRYLRKGATDHVSSAVSALVQSGNKSAARDLIKSCMPSFGPIEP